MDLRLNACLAPRLRPQQQLQQHQPQRRALLIRSCSAKATSKPAGGGHPQVNGSPQVALKAEAAAGMAAKATEKTLADAVIAAAFGRASINPRDSSSSSTTVDHNASTNNYDGISDRGQLMAPTVMGGRQVQIQDDDQLSLRGGVPTSKVLVEPFRQGRLVEGGIVYRQTFVVRSYEVGVDKTASPDTFLNHFQESALNHVWMSGLLGDGFGATHGMIRNHLIWVVSRMQVEFEKYPTWGDILELDTWVGASGKNGMRRDWLLRNYKTGEILARATSTWVMMNQKTRRLSKMPDEVRAEISPWFIDRFAIKDMESSEKIYKLDNDAPYVNSDLQPRRSDLDMNQHVNNVKYLGWMLETVPTCIQNTHELASITLEYRRECGQSDIVQSLTSPDTTMTKRVNEITIDGRKGTCSPSTAHLINQLPVEYLSLDDLETSMTSPCCQYTHLLKLQKDGGEIVRGRTQWRLKQIKMP